MHLTHIQYHSYNNEGDKKFSSGASILAEKINKNKNITCDVGQIMFAQTVTASADTMSQYRNHHFAHPKKWICADIECDAGCGIVPFEYQDKNFVNSLQWAIGLDLFLLIKDPWRIYLTTDHPNGAAFTAYPKLIKLLMDRSFRNDEFSKINKYAQKNSILSSLKREYSLYDIAVLTRAGPAKVLGLKNTGHLGIGAKANITVYSEIEDKEKMFENPYMVIKDGEIVVKNGKIQKVLNGKFYTAQVDYDKNIEKEISIYFEKYLGRNFENFKSEKFFSEENIKKLIYLSNKDYVRDLLLFSICINNKIKTSDIEKLINYVNISKIPKFPISGDYLKKHGYETGEVLGKKLKSLEEKWIENDFIIEKKTIKKSLDKVNQS